MENKTFLQKWQAFLNILCSPGSAIPLIFATICLVLSIFIFTGSLSNLLAIFASILTSIAGFFIKDDWDRLQGNLMLEKKGKSALRNLGAISQQVIQIRKWIKSFVSKKETSKRELEEIDRHLNTMEMHLKSGLADWTDIVPELKNKEEVSKNYDDTIKEYIEERLENQKKLLRVGANKDLKEQLESRIKELEEKVKSLRREQYSASVSPSASIGTISLPSIDLGNNQVNSIKKTCSNCGKTYNEDFSNWLSPIGSASPTLGGDLCKDCRSLPTL